MSEYSNDPVNDADRYYHEVGMEQEMLDTRIRTEEDRIQVDNDWYESVLNSVADPTYELAALLRELDTDTDDAIAHKDRLLRQFARENVLKLF